MGFLLEKVSVRSPWEYMEVAHTILKCFLVDVLCTRKICEAMRWGM